MTLGSKWIAACFACSLAAVSAYGQNGLQVSYGDKGVSRITYNGVVLEDLGSYSSDQFHIWHMKSSDFAGNAITVGQYGWGESNNGTSWDAGSKTETYQFQWGSIATQFVQSGDTLNMIVTERNNPGSGVVFDGAEIYPFALHFPQMPANFYGYSQYAITTTGPGVSVADYGSGVVTSVVPNESAALYGGWKSAGGTTYTPLMTTTAPDGLATFLPHNDVGVQPGQSFTYTVSLRFTPEGTAANASDAYASFAATYPSQMTWTDRRILGTAYLASSPSNSNINQPGGFPTNPRRYFNDSSVDITTGTGMRNFQSRMLAQAGENVRTAQQLNSQGVITWDIEGEQYPQNTSYVCSPEQIARVAPEMELPVMDSSSAYYGQPLDTAYFRTMTDAGLRVGVCLRPQVFGLNADGTAQQTFLSGNAAVIANLEKKAQFANARWGVTIFYVDSTVDVTGGTLDPAIFQQLITDMPGFLFIPEESTPRYYAYSAPFYSFIFHTDLGTPASILQVYPKAFGANLVNDVSASTLSTYTPQLVAQVKQGDILMGLADFWQQNDPTLVSIYQQAGAGSAPAPVQATPVISWAQPAAIGYGTALGSGQLNATANIAGTFVYSPAAGSVPNAGTTTLVTTFTPSDTTNYKIVTASTTLTVQQAVPVIVWPQPGSLAAGTALGSTQLNATANVAGSFSYSPATGTVLGVGTATLAATFTPNDTVDYATASATTNLQVTAVQQRTPNVSWNQPSGIVYGTALGGAQLDATADVAGTFSYSPGAGTVVGAGSTTLLATFTPADTTNYKAVTTSTTLAVAKAVPVVQWSTPGAIAAGTALDGAELNATANVAGSWSYSPGPGTVLNAGSYTLQALFTPADAGDYSTQTATTGLTVNAAAPVNVNLAVLAPSAGQTVSGTIYVTGYVNLFLDAAGTFLMVDGQEVGTHRTTNAPWVYPLDTTTLGNGAHVLQLWGHDIGNNTTISAGVPVVVAN